MRRMAPVSGRHQAPGPLGRALQQVRHRLRPGAAPVVGLPGYSPASARRSPGRRPGTPCGLSAWSAHGFRRVARSEPLAEGRGRRRGLHVCPSGAPRSAPPAPPLPHRIVGKRGSRAFRGTTLGSRTSAPQFAWTARSPSATRAPLERRQAVGASCVGFLSHCSRLRACWLAHGACSARRG